VLSAFDTPQAAAKFMYAGAARQAEDDDDDTPRWGRKDNGFNYTVDEFPFMEDEESDSCSESPPGNTHCRQI
jgi:hypothetical protein